MTTELRDTDAASLDVAGVFIEYRDCLGNTLGQAAYFDWCVRPVPAIGDSLTCLTTSPVGAEPRKLQGRVIARHFDIQNADDGTQQVWVRLEVEVASSSAARRKSFGFSHN